MSAASDDRLRAEAQARFECLSTTDEVLFDMSEAAWVSMERNDFAQTTGERAKLDYLKGVRDAVKRETNEARRSWRAALERDIAQQRTRTGSRRIERSR
ncbi:hypothetical protein ACIBJI_41425 [Nocardia sp. NPDC050408]|uniref:hypothetical protein n=1 Tax=Nocardia sp. NPDC050408 TaxID=3364319 RepID=UPI0037A548FC